MGTRLDDVWWREEILQAMYWMLGEGLAREVSASTLRSFLAQEEEPIRRHLERLAAAGDLVRTGAETYALSPGVMAEAGGLFARGFGEMVNRSAHGSECSRPDCVCRTRGPEECVEPVEGSR